MSALVETELRRVETTVTVTVQSEVLRACTNSPPGRPVPCLFTAHRELIPITSALAVVPKVDLPNYSATKASLHSWAISLRGQLKGTNVQVMEILPPLVESELHDRE
ncbi:hypothetical protein GSI_06321 [Ganoderma sinense ZZ0214-1]|uniref:Uncharacterized protein n=1 Tax=Ganoderma sinense ZZ0214-1 TaxID=1077348 RepID=A0A2G8SCX9_9APHY|nr:hypothetical protein GSI_06321 [Ganoderma sinense ZZ0214-1]